MKNAITELKNSLEEFNIRLGQQKKKKKSANSIVHFENFQSEKQNEKQ